jgi:hypothetical protein
VATHDYVIANGTGAAVRSDLNDALAAIVSQNSSSSAPATMYAYMLWADTTAGIMKMRNGANSAWTSLWELDGTFIATDISLSAGTAAAPSLYFTGDTNTGIYSPGADQVAISTGGTARLTTTTTGITSALAVDVPLGAVGTPSITFTGDTNTGIYSPAADTLAFVEGGVEALRIDSSGRVGIGSSSPGGLLEVKSADQNPNIFRLYNAYNAGASSWGVDFYRNTDSGDNLSVAEIKAVRAGGNTSELKFGTSSTPGTVIERFRIGSAGQLGIGGATYGTSGQVLTSGGASAAPSWQDTGGGAGTLKAWVNFNGTGTVAIRGSGNVSSITDNGTGDYTVNFTTAMADVNYSLSANSSNGAQGTNDEYTGISAYGTDSYLAGSVRIGCVRWRYDVQVMFDVPIVSVAIFR